MHQGLIPKKMSKQVSIHTCLYINKNGTLIKKKALDFMLAVKLLEWWEESRVNFPRNFQ